MPRPPDGYHNRAGDPIPGTHDPISRFTDKTRLMYWAHKQGRLGIPLNDPTAIDIGSTVHLMAEHDLFDRDDGVILQAAYSRLKHEADIAKAITCFNEYRAWRTRVWLDPIAIEEALVSERLQYGGTPDLVAWAGNRRGIKDFKTSTEVYLEHLLGLAGHMGLWNENFPDQPIETCSIILLPKDGSGFRECVWDAADLAPYWQQFQLQLACYRLLPECEAVLREGALVIDGGDMEFTAA
jgi:hypothetical protein